MTLVKICGITSFDDASSAVDAGADMLGFNFYPKSPRYIKPENAAEIIRKLPGRTISVGVFVNVSDPREVARIADESGVGIVQLHGDESPGYCSTLAGRSVIKA